VCAARQPPPPGLADARASSAAVCRPALPDHEPKSGGRKVGRFDLVRKAQALGAEVFVMDGPEPVDAAQVARAAVAGGRRSARRSRR
jgi:hypothetical protein